MGRFFTLIIIFILSSKHIIAQENIIEHPIKKGESVYVISKKYGVSMNAIFELNPGSRDIIYAGRILRIPKNNVSQASSEITDTKVSNYEVKRGETKSGLSRRFGVSIAQLEQQNPHTIRMLQAGHIINIDKTIKEEAPTVNKGEHLVLRGETLWGISKQYGISVAQLTSANTNQLSEFLQIGQILTIPDKNDDPIVTGEYLVKRGDTKFELAKRFNITITELEQKNPHIINMLMAGHKLDITKTSASDTQNDDTEDTLTNIDVSESEEPSISEEEEEEEEEEEDKTATGNLSTSEVVVRPTDSISATEDIVDTRYKNYIIQPKETLFSLSRKAGMTIDEFTSLNPKLLTSVNAGDAIRMPTEALDILTNDNEDIEIETIDSVNENPNTSNNKNISLYSNLDTTSTNGIYFYTPFSSDELSSSELRENMVNNSSDYIRFVDFFQGAQIAIDSAKALNLNFDITLIKNNNLRSKLNIESPFKKNAILIPFLENSNDYPEITSNESLSIIDIDSDIVADKNNIIYKPIPSEYFQKEKTLSYIANQDAQVLVVTDIEETQNKSLIQKLIPDAKFLKVDNAGFFKSNALINTLSKNKLNYVILDNEKTIVFLNTTTALMKQLADYDIQLVLIESSLIPKQSEVSRMRYRILKLIFPAIIHPESNESEIGFKTVYQGLYNTEPSRAAILGFNITLDVLLRISQNTKFADTNTITSEHPHIKFDYEKIGDKTYSNTSLYLMQYDSNKGIIVLKNR